MKKNQIFGSLLLTFVAVIWGTAFVFQRVGMDSIEPITFTAARMSLAAAAVGLVSMCQKPREAEDKKSTLAGGIFCGLFLATASIFQQMGMVYTTAGKAGFITALYMLLVPILNFVLFKKKNTWLVWTGVAFGIAGMYLLCINEGFRLAYGDTLVCICAVLFSGHILCCDHFVSRANPIRMSAIQFLTTAVISWIAAFLLEEPSIGKILSAMIPILYCGIVSGGVGYTLQMVAQKYTDPTIASLLMSLESVFAVIAGVILLNEQMTTRELIGCVIMFAAIIVVQIPLKNSKDANK